MDIYLPDGNGLDVVRQPAGAAEAPDVIVISAARDLAAVRAAMQLGAVHYLVKPFGYHVLAERLSAYQRLRRRIERLGPRTRAGRRRRAVRAAHAHRAPPTARSNKGHSAPTLELVRDAVRASAATSPLPRSPSRSASVARPPSAT